MICTNRLVKEVIGWKAFTSLTLWSCQMQRHANSDWLLFQSQQFNLALSQWETEPIVCCCACWIHLMLSWPLKCAWCPDWHNADLVSYASVFLMPVMMKPILKSWLKLFHALSRSSPVQLLFWIQQNSTAAQCLNLNMPFNITHTHTQLLQPITGWFCFAGYVMQTTAPTVFAVVLVMVVMVHWSTDSW